MNKPIKEITKEELNNVFRKYPSDPLAQIGTMNALIVFKLNELVDTVNKLKDKVRSLKNQTNRV